MTAKAPTPNLRKGVSPKPPGTKPPPPLAPPRKRFPLRTLVTPNLRPCEHDKAMWFEESEIVIVDDAGQMHRVHCPQIQHIRGDPQPPMTRWQMIKQWFCGAKQEEA